MAVPPFLNHLHLMTANPPSASAARARRLVVVIVRKQRPYGGTTFATSSRHCRRSTPSPGAPKIGAPVQDWPPMAGPAQNPNRTCISRRRLALLLPPWMFSACPKNGELSVPLGVAG